MSSTAFSKLVVISRKKNLKKKISGEGSVVSKWCQATQRSLDYTEWESKMQNFLECDTCMPEQLLILQTNTLKLIDLLGEKVKVLAEHLKSM